MIDDSIKRANNSTKTENINIVTTFFQDKTKNNLRILKLPHQHFFSVPWVLNGFWGAFMANDVQKCAFYPNFLVAHC